MSEAHHTVATLHSCPFCGEAAAYVEEDPINKTESVFFGLCEACGSEGPPRGTSAEAALVWNTRKLPWIAVETPPDDAETVMASLRDGDVTMAWYDSAHGTWVEAGSGGDLDGEVAVTHWMPVLQGANAPAPIALLAPVLHCPTAPHLVAQN